MFILVRCHRPYYVLQVIESNGIQNYVCMFSFVFGKHWYADMRWIRDFQILYDHMKSIAICYILYSKYIIIVC